MKKIILIIAMGAFFSLFNTQAAHADEELAPGYNACIEKADSTVDNVECLNSAYDYWDKKLNINYKASMKNCEGTENQEKCRNNLKTAQRLWIKYRDAMAESLYSSGCGGTLDRLTVMLFLATEVKKQAKLLAPTSSE